VFACRYYSVLLASSWAILGPPGQVLSAPLSPEIAATWNHYEKTRLNVLEKEAELDLLRTAGGLGLPVRLEARLGEKLTDPQRVAELIRDELDKAGKQRQKALDGLAQASAEDRREAAKLWHAAMNRKLAFLQEVAEVESTTPIIFLAQAATEDTKAATTAQPVLFWDTRLKLIGSWGLALLLVSILLAYHEVRVGVRREWRAGRFLRALLVPLRDHPSSVGAHVVLFASLLLEIAGCSTTASRNTTTGQVTLLTVVTDLDNSLRRQLDDMKPLGSVEQKKLENARQEILKQLDAFFAFDANVAKAVRQEIKKAYKIHDEVLLDVYVARALTAHADKLLTKVGADQVALTASVTAWRGLQRWPGFGRIAACVTCMILPFVPLLYARQHRRRQLAATARVCPRCLNNGKLEEKQIAVRDPRYPEPKFMQCKAPDCEYEFRQNYLQNPRLCFPTVGILSSGKTHWLVTAYDLIKNTQVPVRAKIGRAPSLGDDRFDVMVQTILTSRQKPGFTRHAIPEPLLFHVTDTDRLGRSAAMLNVFDFSGEVMSQTIDRDVFRRRALLMDGFVLFLDPTQVRGGGTDLTIREQIKALYNFHDDMRDMRALDPGKSIPMPVAVCISKLDLLVTKNPFGSLARPWIRELLKTESRLVTLQTLRQRSRMCERVLSVMFPGWDLARTLRENFGTNYLFFPLTPVGLVEKELGVEDLTQRTIAPFGVLEPILWLLHMHGYTMFR
jgi:hypothetical protein